MQKIVHRVSPQILLKDRPALYFRTTKQVCGCNNEQTLKTYKTKTRTIWILSIGECLAHETIMQCGCCKTLYHSDELQKIVPHGGNFGFDVIVQVGHFLFQECINEKEIKAKLNEMNISISLSEIAELGKKYIIYLAQAHKASLGKIKEYMYRRGGYILHLDGTCEGGSPHLMSSTDELSKFIIGNVKMPSENSKYITPFLEELKKSYGIPLAIVHDMSAAIIKSVEYVFPNVLDYICHYHFLRDIGKDLFDRQYQMLSRHLKNSGIRSELRSIARELKLIIDGDTDLTTRLNNVLSLDDIKTLPLKLKPEIKMYLLVAWVLESKIKCNGYGFPFDRTHLDFYFRAKQAYSMIKKTKYKLKLRGVILPTKGISKAVTDYAIKNLVGILQERISVFDRLRGAMRIALPDGQEGLNDDGDDEDIASIKKAVTEFRYSDEVITLANNNTCYRGMVKQIDKYWEKLFCDPIEVATESGKEIIQPQRTNNIMERVFRREKHDWRKKSGTGRLGRKLKSILADTPLVKNLEHPEYRAIILNGCDTLEERFSEIDIKVVREMLKEKKESEKKYPTNMCKVFKLDDLPKLLTRTTVSKKTAEF